MAFLGQFVALKGKLEAIFGQFKANCVTIGAIVTLLGQSCIFKGNLGHCWGHLWPFWKASIFLYIQAYMLLYIKASMTL